MPDSMRAIAALLAAGVVLAACLGGDDPAPGDAGHSAGADIAAGVPDTEIYLAELSWHGHGPEISEPRNITRRPGYDNQPKFMPDGRSLVYSSIRDGKQSDVYRFLIEEGQSVPYALTDESEYSPTPMPDQSGLSVVRVEADGTQRLWRLPAANAEPQLLFPGITGVGYHAWLPGERAAMFIVAEPPLLLLAAHGDGSRREVAGDVGRSLSRIPGENALAFIDKQEAATWRIARYDLATGSLAELIDTPPGSEDFAWAPGGGVFMGDGAVLLYWDGQSETHWQVVSDLAGRFPGRITRLDVSRDGDMLAFVLAPEAGP